VTKAKPWSASERENTKSKERAMFVLWKAKFKDFASGNNDDVETLQFEKMMGALRNGSVFQVEGTGNVLFEESQIQRLCERHFCGLHIFILCSSHPLNFSVRLFNFTLFFNVRFKRGAC